MLSFISTIGKQKAEYKQDYKNPKSFFLNLEQKLLCIRSYSVLLVGDALCIPRSIVILQNYDLTAILAQPREFSAHCKLL